MSANGRRSWREQDAVRQALGELVGNVVALVVDDVASAMAALEAAEPKVRERAIERWGVEDAWRAFASDSLIRLERQLTEWSNGTAPAKAREGA